MQTLVADLDTPTVVCDLDVLDRNLVTMSAHCRDLGIPFRVHTKSHKIPEIAHRQVASEETARGLSEQAQADNVDVRVLVEPDTGARRGVQSPHDAFDLNLHDELAGMRNGMVEVVWPVAGRGKVK